MAAKIDLVWPIFRPSTFSSSEAEARAARRVVAMVVVKNFIIFLSLSLTLDCLVFFSIFVG